MSERKGDREPVLHVYALTTEHGDARIVGNRSGLELLRECIDDALRRETTAEVEPFAADGEGYDLQVVVWHGDCHDAEWEHWPAPYFERRTQ